MKTLLPLLLFALGAVLASPGAAAEPPPRPAETKPLDYMIVVTGGELLEGVYPDAHTPYLTRTLRPLGCRCVGSLTVDDNREDMRQALRFATNKAPLVIVTGGLGPTPNDITRETLAEFTGIALHEHPDALADMERRFNQSRDQLRPNLRRQTLVPTRGGYLKNPAGTAVGLVFEAGGPVIVALPGPPRELQAMVREELVPYLRRRFDVRNFGCSLTLRFVGAGQSLIDQTIKEHVSIAPDVTITSLFESSRVDFTFSLPGNTPADRARLQQLERAVREHLGDYIYADDGASLEEVIVRQLQARGGPLALAEVASGGHLSAALSGVEGASRLLAGAYAAPTKEALARLLQLPLDLPEQSKKSGADKVKTLAAAAAKLTQSQWVIAVGPVESDEKGAKHIWVAFKMPEDRWETERWAVRDSGEIHPSTLTTQILDRLRRQLK
ncbi:MAG: CinA family protein [Chloroflexi bacterium]|nr:CinA family protein [Chloroflexota bacterium]